jgi:hypothetical protein
MKILKISKLNKFYDSNKHLEDTEFLNAIVDNPYQIWNSEEDQTPTKDGATTKTPTTSCHEPVPKWPTERSAW